MQNRNEIKKTSRTVTSEKVIYKNIKLPAGSRYRIIKKMHFFVPALMLTALGVFAAMYLSYLNAAIDPTKVPIAPTRVAIIILIWMVLTAWAYDIRHIINARQNKKV